MEREEKGREHSTVFGGMMTWPVWGMMVIPVLFPACFLILVKHGLHCLVSPPLAIEIRRDAREEYGGSREVYTDYNSSFFDLGFLGCVRRCSKSQDCFNDCKPQM